MNADTGSNQPSILHLISRLAVKLSNQRSETDPKHISNEKLQIIYKKLLDKKVSVQYRNIY
jgi:flagellar biosynthesis component FlhA